jgi:hypothetical protein
MTVEQWLPILIALLTPVTTLAIVMVGFLYNNGRISELTTSVDRRIEDLKDLIKANAERQRDLINTYSDRHDAKLARLEDSLLSKFAELDTRLSRIESRMS